MLANQAGPHFPGHTINCHLKSHRVVDCQVWRASVLVSKVISLWAVSPEAQPRALSSLPQQVGTPGIGHLESVQRGSLDRDKEADPCILAGTWQA